MDKSKKTIKTKKPVIYDKTKAGCDINNLTKHDHDVINFYKESRSHNMSLPEEKRFDIGLEKIKQKKPLNKSEFAVISTHIDSISLKQRMDCAKNRNLPNEK
jgi:hypothetical protein